MECAKRLRGEISRWKFLAEEPYGPLQLTASLGVASFPDDARVPEELLRRADDAMYRVKAERRDGVAAALPQQAPPREQLLQKTLTTAQKLADDVRENARKEAQIVVSEAELQGEKIVQGAQQKRLQLIKEIDDLKRLRLTFLQQLSSLLDTHKALVDSVRGDPATSPGAEDNVSFFAAPTKRADTKK